MVFNGPKTDRPTARPTVRLSLLFLCHLVMGLRIDANPYFAQRTKAKLGAPSSVFRNAPLESYPANPKQCHTYVEHSKIEVLSKSSKKSVKFNLAKYEHHIPRHPPQLFNTPFSHRTSPPHKRMFTLFIRPFAAVFSPDCLAE